MVLGSCIIQIAIALSVPICGLPHISLKLITCVFLGMLYVKHLIIFKLGFGLRKYLFLFLLISI